MNDFRDDFVPYEQALQLKELGFDESCLAKYDRNCVFILDNSSLFCKNNDSLLQKLNQVSAPLYQQAFRWFRERYRIHSYIFSCGNKPPTVEEYYESYYYVIQEDYLGNICGTFEEAELECIKKLIEICKN